MWKIVDVVEEDVFRDICAYKIELFRKKSVPLFVNDENDLTLNSGEDYNDIFWRLWPASIDNDF